jgi:HPt (histidine-containing phosphotransfer) domain-containing protein
MTAHALKGDREKCLAAGMDDYITKPIDVKSVSTILEKWLILTPKQETAPTETKLMMPANEALVTELANERLKEIFGNDEEAIKNFLQSFVDVTSILLDDIQSALQEKNAQTLKEHLHRLKGSSANSGFNKLKELALNSESLVAQNDWLALEKMIGEVTNEFSRLTQAIKQFKKPDQN